MVDFGVQEGGSVGGALLGFGVGFVKFSGFGAVGQYRQHLMYGPPAHR